jgi:hypothetical protein
MGSAGAMALRRNGAQFLDRMPQAVGVPPLSRPNVRRKSVGRNDGAPGSPAQGTRPTQGDRSAPLDAVGKSAIRTLFALWSRTSVLSPRGPTRLGESGETLESKRQSLARCKRTERLGHTINGKLPGSLTSRQTVINPSQGLRDQMNCTGCDEESQCTDRAGLAERPDNGGWKFLPARIGSYTALGRGEDLMARAGMRSTGGDEKYRSRMVPLQRSRTQVNRCSKFA